MKLKKIKKDEKKKEKIDYEPFDYSIVKEVSGFVPSLIGYDNNNNSYWYGYDFDNKKWVISIYDKDGKSIAWFYTAIIDGDEFSETALPKIDYHGNVYMMQRWIKDGVKIWKYERKW